jgi:uncharacterized protein (TIGR02246 family)
MFSTLAICLFPAAFAWSAYGQNANTIPAAIDKLHKDDITATISRDVEALTALYDDDAVLLQPGTPPIVGKAAFRDFMKQMLAKSSSVKVVEYVPDIRDIRVTGDVAYEWGYFDAAQKSSEQQAPKSLRAKLLRVIRRQPDGSWKFTRVMWLAD